MRGSVSHRIWRALYRAPGATHFLCGIRREIRRVRGDCGHARALVRTRPYRLNFPGCSLGPSPFASAIKCHQKSTSNSAGSSVGSLTPPRATPRLGGAAVSCQYFPCSFVLALRDLGLRLGVRAPLPLRASSRGVLPGAPNTLSVSSGFHPRDSRFVISSHGSKWLESRHSSAASPAQGRPELLAAPNEVTRGDIKACFGLSRKSGWPRGEFGRLHVVSQTAFHLVSLTSACFSPNFQFSDGEHPRWAYFGHQYGLSPGTCVRSQPPAVSGDLNSRI
jgi:hypothetical protein